MELAGRRGRRNNSPKLTPLPIRKLIIGACLSGVKDTCVRAQDMLPGRSVIGDNQVRQILESLLPSRTTLGKPPTSV